MAKTQPKAPVRSKKSASRSAKGTTGLAALNQRNDWPKTNLLCPAYEVGDLRTMPFVVDRDPKGENVQRTFWAPEEGFPQRSPATTGVLCAGAYLQYSLVNGPGQLAGIVAAMPKILTECEINFFATLEKYLQSSIEMYPSIGKHVATLLENLRKFDDELSKEPDWLVIKRLATALNVTTHALFQEERGVRQS